MKNKEKPKFYLNASAFGSKFHMADWAMVVREKERGGVKVMKNWMGNLDSDVTNVI